MPKSTDEELTLPKGVIVLISVRGDMCSHSIKVNQRDVTR